MKQIVLVGVVIVGLLAGAWFFIGRGSSSETVLPAPTDIPQADIVVEPEQAVVNEEGVLVVQVEAGSYYFNPTEIRVQAGQRVRIELTSKDMMHDFVIDELGVQSDITPAGKTAVVEFTAEEPGTYEYYCSVANHRAQGQVGTLIVE